MTDASELTEIYQVAEAPPEIQTPNPMPLDWHTEIPRMRDLFNRASGEHYDVADGIHWDELVAEDYSPEERVAIAYWLASCATFEQSGVGSFGLATIAAYEQHAGHDIAEMLSSLSRDEVNHDDMCRRAADRLIPGFPFQVDDPSPYGEILSAAQRNLEWISYTNSRFWNAFKGAFSTRRLPALLVPFIIGEASSSLIFQQASRNAAHPVFHQLFANIASDEGRHFGFCNLLAKRYFPEFTDEERTTFVKNMRASFIYISAVLDTPRPPFWNMPIEFMRAHERFSELSAPGLGLPPLGERRDMWRSAALRIKGVTDRYDFDFPALPEVGIEGTEVALTEDDLLIVSF